MTGSRVQNEHQSTVTVGGIPFQSSTPSEAVSRCLQDVTDGVGTSIRLTNAYCVALAARDPAYRNVLCGPGVNYPDGAPVAFAMRAFAAGDSMRPKRVRGPSFFRDVLAASCHKPVRHFFLGSTPETLKLLLKQVETDFPSSEIAGHFAPPFGPVTDELVAQAAVLVKTSGANILWVGLGTPKQDFLTARLAALLNIPCIGVGAAFDFVAGSTREAPRWIQRSGFEWLFRLASEPRRLWKRYLVGNFQFLFAVLKDLK